ncbi:phenylacetate-CoA oxygenase/reductase, PaaK subunit [Klebsiella pneumoniae]|nr:phenylacetate-CoA oxygenase/reductase, PaaK subunit [Klebsiella pneumoniae]
MDSDLLQGRIDGDKLRQLADHLLDFSRFDEAFICGPAAMMDEAEAALRELGVAEKSIHLERYNTPGGNVKRAAGVQAEGRTVTIRQTGAIGLSPSAPKTTASWMPHCVRAPICRSPVRAGYAPPVNAKCYAVKWRWPPITAWKQMSWRQATC